MATGDEQRFDWQIFESLRARMGFPTGKTPRERIELGLRDGAYRTGIAELREHPHGRDFGALEPCLPERLLTATGRVELAPPAFLADVARLEAELDAPVSDLVLIGRRQLRSNNSWMHNAPRLMRGPDRCTLMLSPLDARRHDVAAGDRVEVRSRVGAIVVPVEVTADLMAGVASLPHGFGHARAGALLSVASRVPGASINDLTDDERLDDLTGNAALSGIPITLHRAPVEAL